MPAQNLAIPHIQFVTWSDRHEPVIRGLSSIEVRMQKLLAELVMLRLFDEFQGAIAGVALRLACGTPYVDGTQPVLLTNPARSTSGARQMYETFGRRTQVKLRWSRAGSINDTIKYVLAPSNAVNVVCSANALTIAEMQSIRNRIAHSNSRSRAAFSEVVRRHYGAKLNQVSPGMLLISSRFSPTLLEQYLVASRAIVKGCARA